MAQELIVITQDGKESGKVDVNPEVFASRINQRLIELVLNAYAGNQRKGLADTKTRREVRGGGKKPWRQKGTGNARQGSIRSPQWRGGGTVFGPTPRSYRTELPKSMKRKALVAALSLKAKQETIQVIESLKLKNPKTKELAQIIENIKLENKKVLFVGTKLGDEIKRASKNMRKRFKIEEVENVNAYDILRKQHIIIEKDALAALEKRALATGRNDKARKEKV